MCKDVPECVPLFGTPIGRIPAGAGFNGESGNPHGVLGTDFLPRKTLARVQLLICRLFCGCRECDQRITEQLVKCRLR